VGKRKTVSAERVARELNPDCDVQIHAERLTTDNARDILRGYDVVLDGCDNFPTRFVVSDCCRFEGLPLVSAAVLQFSGQLMTVLPGQGNPCYRCFLPEPPPPGLVPSCQEAGVLGTIVGVMGTLQATEALKILMGIGNPLSHHLLLYDALQCSFTTVKRASAPDCPLCSESATIRELVQYNHSCEAPAPKAGGGQS
jgi:adenylyltransferase/sulfurtransferase